MHQQNSRNTLWYDSFTLPAELRWLDDKWEHARTHTQQLLHFKSNAWSPYHFDKCFIKNLLIFVRQMRKGALSKMEESIEAFRIYDFSSIDFLIDFLILTPQQSVVFLTELHVHYRVKQTKAHKLTWKDLILITLYLCHSEKTFHLSFHIWLFFLLHCLNS